MILIKKSNIIFFVSGGITDPASRTRGYAFASGMASMGLRVFFNWSYSFDSKLGLFKGSIVHAKNYAKDFVSRFAIFLSSTNNDLFYVQRGYQVGFPYLLRFFSSFSQIFMIFFVKVILGRVVVFDFDDALYVERPLVSFLFVRTSDCVIVGGHALQKYASQYNQNIFLVPTSVPVETVKMIEKTNESGYLNSNNKPVVLGWLGSPSTLHYLHLLVEPLNTLGLKYDIEFRVIGSRTEIEYQMHKNLFSKFENVKLVLVQWSRETELDELSKFNIGLAPLDSGEIEDGKCGFKLLMYMARGIPCVSSEVGENMHIIEDGKNGFLCSTSQDFQNKLQHLITDKMLQDDFRLNGRITVETRYNLKLNVKHLVEILNDYCLSSNYSLA